MATSSITPKYPDIKVRLKLSGPGGNVFNLIGLTSRALERAGIDATEFCEECMMQSSYNDVLKLISSTVNATIVK